MCFSVSLLKYVRSAPQISVSTPIMYRKSLGSDFGDVADSGRVEAERACGDVVGVDAIMAGVWRYSREQQFVSRYACWVIVIYDESVEKVKEGSTAKTRGTAVVREAR